MAMSVCVFSSSSNAVAPEYFAAAIELGTILAQRNLTLVYGGGKVGLMGAMATAVHQHGGKVVGVIPRYLRREELAYEAADELIVTKDIRERKAVMETRAEAFIAMPGGFGTLEEILEILTLKQLGRHNKPIVLLNTHGFYDPLLAFFEEFYVQGFALPYLQVSYYVAREPFSAVEYIENSQPECLQRNP